MMRLASVVFLLCSFAAVGSAQSGELSVTFGESLFKNNSLGAASTTDSTPYTVGDGFRIGARFTFNTKKFIGHEFGYAYSRSKLDFAGQPDTSMPTHQGFYDILGYLTPEGTRIRPFAAGGVHFTTFVPPGASATYGTGTTKFGVNYGAGIKVKVTSMYALRFDVRDYLTRKPFDLIGRSGSLHQIEASVGVGIFF
jgi:opacity protein-like surface antigen